MAPYMFRHRHDWTSFDFEKKIIETNTTSNNTETLHNTKNFKWAKNKSYSLCVNGSSSMAYD